MAGNVWEWCLNKYENPDTADALRVDGDERGLRVAPRRFLGQQSGGLARVFPAQRPTPATATTTLAFVLPRT